MKKFLLALTCVCQLAVAQTDNDPNPKGSIGINSEFSYKMLEPVQDLRKINILLEERKKGALKNRSLTIGASMIAIADYQKSNSDSRFAYLMRHPTGNNQIGKEVSEAVIHSFQLSFTGAVNSWLTAHAELLYNPEQSFGTGIITDLNRNLVQVRKGFIVIGDLEKFPVYGAIGKMDAPFSFTGSVSPFTNSTLWHAFGGLGYGAQVGFKKWGVHATFMGVQGGSQFRGLTTQVGDSTNVPSVMNNFVADLNYTFNLGEETKLMVGGSYVHGSTYCHSYPVMHFQPCGVDNPAYTYYGNLDLTSRIKVIAGYAETLEVWPGTHNPTPPLNIYDAVKVSSLSAGAKYQLNEKGNVLYTVSGEFSNFTSGDEGSPWERQNQYILGFAGLVNRSSKLFVEVFRTEGYVPLNFISGGNMAPGQTHSERGAESHGIVIGGQLTF